MTRTVLITPRGRLISRLLAGYSKLEQIFGMGLGCGRDLRSLLVSRFLGSLSSNGGQPEFRSSIRYSLGSRLRRGFSPCVWASIGSGFTEGIASRREGVAKVARQLATSLSSLNGGMDSDRVSLSEPIQGGNRGHEILDSLGSTLRVPVRPERKPNPFSSLQRYLEYRSTHPEKEETIQIDPRGEAIGIIGFFPVKDVRSVSPSPSQEWSLRVVFSSPLPASFPSPQLWLMCISSSRQSHPRWHIYPSIGVNRNVFIRCLLPLLTSIGDWWKSWLSRWRAHGS